MSEVRQCVVCGVELPERSGKGRPRKRCVTCAADLSAVAKAWRESNPDRVQQFNRKRRKYQ